MQGNIEVLRIAYVHFHNGSNYDYRYIIKELAEEFKEQFTCLEENTEKYITFAVPIEKEVTKPYKNGKEITKNVSYILQFIVTARFMASSLSVLSIIFLKELIELNVNSDKKCEACGIKCKYLDCFLEYSNFKDDLIEYKCLCCNKNYQYKFVECFIVAKRFLFL